MYSSLIKLGIGVVVTFIVIGSIVAIIISNNKKAKLMAQINPGYGGYAQYASTPTPYTEPSSNILDTAMNKLQSGDMSASDARKLNRSIKKLRKASA